jgi:hypothetical protein
MLLGDPRQEESPGRDPVKFFIPGPLDQGDHALPGLLPEEALGF